MPCAASTANAALSLCRENLAPVSTHAACGSLSPHTRDTASELARVGLQPRQQPVVPSTTCCDYAYAHHQCATQGRRLRAFPYLRVRGLPTLLAWLLLQSTDYHMCSEVRAGFTPSIKKSFDAAEEDGIIVNEDRRVK